MKKKTVALLLSLVLVIGCVVGGTLAWLTAKTKAVENTFTVGDINIDLTETDMKLDQESDQYKNSYKMVPGCTITKDPMVTVLKNSEKCYLFVKLEKSDEPDFDTYLTYEMKADWKELTGVTGVYYRVVDTSSDEDQQFYVLKGTVKDNKEIDQITVKDNVTKEKMESLKKSKKYPTLTVRAYACQFAGNNGTDFTPEEAWKKVNP